MRARQDVQRYAALTLFRRGYSVRRVAATLGVPRSTVHEWQQKARTLPAWREAAKQLVDQVDDADADKIMRQLQQMRRFQEAELRSDVAVAGVAVLATDTGRLLMLQRSNRDQSDPAAGTWEFPGGHLEDGEAALDGATREWGEETGAELPEGESVGQWASPDGRYLGFIHQIPTEDALGINLDHEDREVLNPDDPDGDDIEVVAWWSPEDLPMPAMRQEVALQWPAIEAVLRGTPAFQGAEPRQLTGVMRQLQTLRRFQEADGSGGGHTSVCVALWVPETEARALALEADEVQGEIELADELHLTLAYMGKVGDFDPGELDRLRRVVSGFAAGAPPIDGEVCGTGCFVTGAPVAWAAFDAPALPTFRQRLVGSLEGSGFKVDRTHGFVPHITLAYPTGPAPLTAPQLPLTFTALTLAIGDERVEYPLEGGEAFFAERPGRRSETDDGPRTAPYGKLSGSPYTDADTENDNPRPAKAPKKSDQPADGLDDNDPAKEPDEMLTGPGEVVTEATGYRLMPEEGPPVMDRLNLEAWSRYFNLLRHDVPHHRALDAVRHIDPDFIVTTAQAQRAFHALGKGTEPVKMGEGEEVATEALLQFARINPPAYVQSVYDEFELGPDQIRALADYLYTVAMDSYRAAINDQLIALGLPNIDQVTDPGVLAQLQAEVERIAAGIADTFNRQLGGEVYSSWLELRAERGRMMSRYWLSKAVEDWAEKRAVWKAEQVAKTETSRFFNRGVFDFINRNGHLNVKRMYVTPDECVCDACLSLVLGNPYTPAEANSTNLPLHIGCIHDWVADWDRATAEDLADIWAGQYSDDDLEAEAG